MESKKDEEIRKLKEELQLAKSIIAEDKNKIEALETKNQYLLAGYEVSWIYKDFYCTSRGIMIQNNLGSGMNLGEVLKIFECWW